MVRCRHCATLSVHIGGSKVHPFKASSSPPLPPLPPPRLRPLVGGGAATVQRGSSFSCCAVLLCTRRSYSSSVTRSNCAASAPLSRLRNAWPATSSNAVAPRGHGPSATAGLICSWPCSFSSPSGRSGGGGSGPPSTNMTHLSRHPSGSTTSVNGSEESGGSGAPSKSRWNCAFCVLRRLRFSSRSLAHLGHASSPLPKKWVSGKSASTASLASAPTSMRSTAGLRRFPESGCRMQFEVLATLVAAADEEHAQ